MKQHHLIKDIDIALSISHVLKAPSLDFELLMTVQDIILRCGQSFMAEQQ